MKLSARAFNNVIIFSMLLMIALFNLDQWLPKPAPSAQLRLISDNDLVLRIDIGDARMERVGTQWRIVEDGGKLHRSGDEVINYWLAATLTQVSQSPAAERRVDASIWLARQNAPATVTLINTPQGDYVDIGEFAYKLDGVTFEQLVFN
ncbi:hypothetical protein [Alteromonas facilis]|uniref:hypothetical protein n=1 Tax=Alteromonas facilis TaxID=2048004 RepID=UPI000F5C6E48|nr:hypothetical protein [Alteromonas facilis]